MLDEANAILVSAETMRDLKEWGMLSYQERVVDEKSELDNKLFKLNDFIRGPFCATLPAEEQLRLRRQAVVMQTYSEILAERITAFPAEQAAPQLPGPA